MHGLSDSHSENNILQNKAFAIHCYSSSLLNIDSTMTLLEAALSI